MPLFSVVVHGQCRSALTASGPKSRGFYVARLVAASSDAAAAELAVQLVAGDRKTQMIAKQFDGQPDLSIDSVAPVPWWRRFRRQPGYVVYDESEPPPLDAHIV